MKTDQMLVNAVKVLSAVDVGGKKGDVSLSELDSGILQVSLMISGLDGTILPTEYQAFGEMAKRCRGMTAAKKRALYDASIGKAGFLAGMARSGVYSESDRLKTFVRLSFEVLPKGFDRGSMADLRRAFALWIAMGVADGAFSGIERKAIQSLVRAFALQRAGRTRKFTAIIEPDFIFKVEKLVGEMSVASKRIKAEADLNAFISTVPMTEKGKKVFRPAGRISLSFAGPGPTITGWK